MRHACQIYDKSGKTFKKPEAAANQEQIGVKLISLHSVK